jgi:uncharacterized protein YmfQ (DUF2313 family)
MFDSLRFDQRVQLANGLELDPDCGTLRAIVDRWERKCAIPEWAQSIVNPHLE